ncbi:hypothetical protein EES44_22140 [Streptomyces sp. ADI96-15]|nr:hypothetical protein EES44_22140 [Streptomyces sp. ADI96-15]
MSACSVPSHHRASRTSAARCSRPVSGVPRRSRTASSSRASAPSGSVAASPLARRSSSRSRPMSVPVSSSSSRYPSGPVPRLPGGSALRSRITYVRTVARAVGGTSPPHNWSARTSASTLRPGWRARSARRDRRRGVLSAIGAPSTVRTSSGPSSRMYTGGLPYPATGANRPRPELSCGSGRSSHHVTGRARPCQDSPRIADSGRLWADVFRPTSGPCMACTRHEWHASPARQPLLTRTSATSPGAPHAPGRTDVPAHRYFPTRTAAMRPGPPHPARRPPPRPVLTRERA